MWKPFYRRTLTLLVSDVIEPITIRSSSDRSRLYAVIIQSGTPVEMPWVSQAATVLQAFYGGNAVGYGIADVLFGKLNPSSRLPLTFPIKLSDNPSYLNFGGENNKVNYGKNFVSALL